MEILDAAVRRTSYAELVTSPDIEQRVAKDVFDLVASLPDVSELRAEIVREMKSLNNKERSSFFGISKTSINKYNHKKTALLQVCFSCYGAFYCLHFNPGSGGKGGGGGGGFSWSLHIYTCIIFVCALRLPHTLELS